MEHELQEEQIAEAKIRDQKRQAKKDLELAQNEAQKAAALKEQQDAEKALKTAIENRDRIQAEKAAMIQHLEDQKKKAKIAEQ